jgi:hypothetical protein
MHPHIWYNSESSQCADTEPHAAVTVANAPVTPAHERAWGGRDNMKTDTLAATAGIVALSVLSAVTAHGAETRLRSQAKAPSPTKVHAPSAATGVLDAGLLAAAALAAHKDTDPTLNGTVQEPQLAASAVAPR